MITKIWIYEYKDDETPVGATFLECPMEELPHEIILPHLNGDWHWRIEHLYEDEERDK